MMHGQSTAGMLKSYPLSMYHVIIHIGTYIAARVAGELLTTVSPWVTRYYIIIDSHYKTISNNNTRCRRIGKITPLKDL